MLNNEVKLEYMQLAESVNNIFKNCNSREEFKQEMEWFKYSYNSNEQFARAIDTILTCLN